MKDNKKIVIYALTRGYRGIRRLKYLKIVKRNWYVTRSAKFGYDLILFHEGNINYLDIIFIQLFSMRTIKFVNIKSDFRPNLNSSIKLDHNFTLGYVLMCQFQYFHVWKYLSNYEYAIRVDEDCLVNKFPLKFDSQLLECGAITQESHALTNLTLPMVLKKLALDKYYDQKFPYTNVFVTRVAFWLQNDVQNFLKFCYEHPDSLRNRWGDLPIIGVALKYFGNWEAEKAINLGFSYSHSSHANRVNNGRIISGSKRGLQKLKQRREDLNL